MTAYFDDKACEIADLRGAPQTSVDAWEEALVRDMVLACEYDRFDGRDGPLAFPADLRDEVYRKLLASCMAIWPSGVPYGGPDYETDAERHALLERLVSGLHTSFHAAAHADWPGRDGPTAPVVAMASRAEERMIALIRAERKAPSVRAFPVTDLAALLTDGMCHVAAGVTYLLLESGTTHEEVRADAGEWTWFVVGVEGGTYRAWCAGKDRSNGVWFPLDARGRDPQRAERYAREDGTVLAHAVVRRVRVSHTWEDAIESDHGHR